MPNWVENPIDSALVYIGYTKKELIIFSKNFQNGVNANSKRRDAVGVAKGQEDMFGVIIAPFGIGKDVYYIAVNPNGAIYDKMFSNFGETEWDGDINAKVEITEYGWNCLITIPFSSISYKENIWGIQIMRIIMRNAEIQTLYPTRSLNFSEDLAEISFDFNYIEKTKRFSIGFFPSARFYKEDTLKIKLGGTSRFKEGTSTLFDFIYNPDFSEIDVDFFKFDLKRLPINYPEKRIFFTEGLSLLKMPQELLRTRNIENPIVGGKFYSIGDKLSFISYYVQDTLLKDIFFARTSYNPIDITTLGIFFINNKIDYNIFSIDFTQYFKNILTTGTIQYSRNISNGKNLIYLSIDKEEKPGLAFGLSYIGIDSFINNPLNYALIDFDGVQQGYGYLNYRFTKKYYTIMPYFEYLKIINRYDYKLEIMEHYTFNLYAQYLKLPIPITVNIGFSYDEMPYIKDYMSVNNTASSIFSIALGYCISSWNQFTITSNFGKYLDGNLENYQINFRFPIFSVYNFGLSINVVNSLYDSLTVYENYGEIFLYKNLFFKPYISYSENRMLKTADGEIDKKIIINGVFGYEPKYQTNFYFAIRREYDITHKKLTRIYSKDVLKFQLGLGVNF